MRKVTLPNEFLGEAAEALKKGERVRIFITGQSMYPFIRSGKDTVEIVPCPPEGELPELCCPFYCWEGHYMIHRYIGRRGDDYLMLGDGNLARIERVKRSEIIGLLHCIRHADGTVQDCNDPRWLRRARWWVRLRPIRRWLIAFLRYIVRY